MAEAVKENEKYEKPAADPKVGAETESESLMDKLKGFFFGETEQTFEQSSYYPDSQKKPHNPDPLVMKDYTYGVYEDMLMDEQISVALNLKKDLVVGSGWHLQHDDEDVKSELQDMFEDDSDRPLSEMLQDVCQAYEYGFSLSEKLFKKLDDGRICLRDIKPRHPSTWLIHTDVHGNVEKYEQRGPKNSSLDVDAKRLIHYINNDKHQNPYGRSDLYTAYQAWLSKRHVVRFYSIYLESAASPKPVAKYDIRAPQSVVDDIFNVIKKFQTKTAMAIPKEFEVEFLEAKTNGEAYIKALNFFNMSIGRSLCIPDLIGLSGSETAGGSFTLGKEQIGLFYKHIYKRRETLERIMDQHIIRPICIYNYGLMDKYPKFKFKPLSEEDAIKQAELWIKGVQGAGWKPTPEEVNHFRTLVKFPESEEVELKMDAMDPNNPDNPNSPVNKDGEPVKPGEEKPDEKSGDPKEDAVKKKAFALKLSTLSGEYHKKTDFKLADQMLKAAVNKTIVQTQPIVDDIFEDLYDQIQKKKVLEKQNIPELKLRHLSKLQQVFKRNLRNMYYDAQDVAKSEVKKKDFANIPADEFLDFLNQETFKYIGDYEYNITKKTKEALIKAIKDGDPLSDVIKVLDNEGKKLSDVSLERYARTKTTEVYNRGRMEFFEASGIVEAYQFSAILDDVTSEICGDLHGKIFKADDAPCPPLHFNCRSVMIPVTKYEDYKIDKKTNSGESIDAFIKENVEDRGFSRN